MSHSFASVIFSIIVLIGETSVKQYAIGAYLCRTTYLWWTFTPRFILIGSMGDHIERHIIHSVDTYRRTHAHTHARLHARAHRQTHTIRFTQTHTHTHTHARTHARTHTHTHTHVRTHARTHSLTHADPSLLISLLWCELDRADV